MNNCKYCNLNFLLDPYFGFDYWENSIKLDDTQNAGWTSLRMGLNEDAEFSLFAIGDDVAVCKINYCPFCGSELNKKIKAEE